MIPIKNHVATPYDLTNYYMISVSGKRELNPRPSGPEPDALAPALLPESFALIKSIIDCKSLQWFSF